MTAQINRADRNRRLWQFIGEVTSAHVIALRDGELIGDEGLGVLVSAIESTRSAPPPESGALLRLIAEFDQRVDAITPAGFSGAANIGRGEIDLAATVARMSLRSDILTVAARANVVVGALLEVASAHTVSLMPAYVNGQIAQPTTFGHLLGAVIAPFLRGSVRLAVAYETVNRSPFGSGSLASTGMSIDRERLAELLGFGGLVENTFDAVSSTDHFTETAEAIGAMVTSLRRWLEELLLWMRAEPGSFVIATESTSLIAQVPQGKFPDGLTGLIGDMRSVERAVAEVRSLADSIPFGPLTGQLDQLIASTEVATANAASVLSDFADLIQTGLTVNRALLANRAGKGFSTASDLAEFLMLEEQIDPGSARNIAALTISTARDQGLESAGITQELIDGAALMVIGQEIKVEFEAISRYIAPRRFIERRTATGAPSPASTRAYLESAQSQITLANERWNRLEANLARADQIRRQLETEALNSEAR